MAVRLPVILSQPARRDAATTDLVENLVAATLLVPGLDANLIGDISTVELGSTDHVCLLGHTRDLVLASFLTLDEARAAWLRLEQTGHWVDLSQDEARIRSLVRDATGGRRVYYHQLKVGQGVDRLLDQCRKLLAAQQLSLVSIQGLVGSGKQLPTVTAKPSIAVRMTPAATPVGGSNAGSSVAAQTAARGDGPTSLAGVGHGMREVPVEVEVDDQEEWSALDQLVDDLDAMDL